VTAQPEDRQGDAQIVSLRPGDRAGELATPSGDRQIDQAPARWVARWADHPLLEQSPGELARVARWHARATWRAGVWAVLHLHLIVWREARPTGVGLVVIARAIRDWQRCAEDQDRNDAMEDRTAAGKLSEKLRPARARRFWLLAVLLAATVGGGWWAFAVYGWPVPLLSGLAVFGLADLLGRRVSPVEDPVSPPPMPVLIDDPDVPIRQLQQQILDTFEREGFAPGAVGVAMPLTYDPARMDYRMAITCLDEVKPQHLRAIERSIGAADFAARNLATASSTIRLLVIRRGDPLANVPPPSRLPVASRSIVEGLDLGESAGDVDFVIPAAGVHIAVIGKTGSGKSKGCLWAIIDRLSVCDDAVLWGVDLARGPALPMWRGVIQRAAYTVDDTAALLEAALAEIDRRMAVLTALAEDDDPDNDTDEWQSGLGPALVVVVDEFALLAAFNGEKGRADLLARVETIVRTGRKVWVTLVLGTQKSGNSDLGSTTMASQIGVKILLACAEGDTVKMLGTEARDAGWAPHHLRPSVEGDPRDAGKAYVDSPRHRTPDVYRCWSPMPVREVKDRARQRIADGLPTLDGGTTADAVEVPEVLAWLEARFGERRAAELRTAELVEASGGRWSAETLAAAVREHGFGPRPLTGGRARGYHLADVETAIEHLS
jgi:hypothetical protein